MKGLTLYLNLLSPARKWATDEELGRYLRLALDAAETETIPIIEDERDGMLFEGFTECIKKGIECVNAKKQGINNRWKNVNSNENFNMKPMDIKPAIEKRSMPSSDKLLHSGELEMLFKNAINNNTIGLDTVKNDIKRLLREQFKEEEKVNEVFNKLLDKYNNEVKF